MQTKETLKKILSQSKEVQFAYLFGSYADGSLSANSDVDVAIYIDKDVNIFDTKLKIHHKLEIALNKEVDIVILNNIKNFYLLQNIFNNNMLLKDSKSDERVMYELAKQHEIIDYMDFKRMLNVA